jgi:hypothetical protein
MRFLIALCLTVFTLFNLNLKANDSIPTIHVFGDSHSMEFTNIPKCNIYWLGPVTMHRMGRDGLNFLNLRAMNIQEGQAVVFAFGEIDVRCHIGKQRDQGSRNLDEIIETLATKYIHAILKNRDLYNHITCIVYSVTPPIDGIINPAYPYYGSLEDRIHITQKLNARLARLCQQVGIEFLDVYEDYATTEGSLNVALSDGCVHIHGAYNQAIHQKLYKLLLK